MVSKRLYGILVFSLCSLLLAAFPVHHAQSSPHPAPGNSVFGVNSHIASRYPDPSSFHVPVGVLESLGVGWVREDFQFHRIQPEPDTFDWMFHDNAIDELTQQGFQIIGVLNGPTPGWATPNNADGTFTPPNPDDFASFAAAVVNRYKGQVHYWEVWNEPDNGIYWQPSPDPAAYTSLLIKTSAAIKAADPNAKVLVAGMVSPEPAATFLQEIANNGGWNAFDIISLHPYTDDPVNNPGGAPETGQIVAAGIGRVQAQADSVGSKPIWVTEFGWSTGGSGGRDTVSEADQARYIVRGAAMLRAAGVERILSYNFKDDRDMRYGLLNWGGGLDDYASMKPAFYAYQTLNQQLAGTTPGGMVDLGHQQMVLDFEQSQNWSLGDQKNGSFSHTAGQGRDGSTAGQLGYTASSNSFIVFLPATPPTIPANTSQLKLWVRGNNSGHGLKVWLRDSQGTLQYRLGYVGGGNWNQMSVSIDQVTSDVINGPGNRRLSLPATLEAIVLEAKSGAFSDSGTVYLDDMIATGGPQVYGARFNKGGGVVDVLWSPQVTTIPVPTRSGQGTVVNSWGDQNTVSASNGSFQLTLGPDPVYLSHTPGQVVGPQPQPQPQPQPTTPPAQPTTPPSQPTRPTPAPPPPGGEVPDTCVPQNSGYAGEECFSQTGYCIQGCIREYWHENGGLPVFGYPIGPQQTQMIEGSPFQAQWFERNRLELHPENQRPYHVLLGRLSEELLYRQNRVWQDEPKSSPKAGCLYFEATGFNVCGDILTAWQADGLELDGLPGKTQDENLALFGLPLGEASVETINGEQYVVQWFERARFELHPENPPPYNVLLGLLGNESQGN